MAKEKRLASEDELTRDVHVWPDFHGNRSPLADPSLRGMVSAAHFKNFNSILEFGDYLTLCHGISDMWTDFSDRRKKFGHFVLSNNASFGGKFHRKS